MTTIAPRSNQDGRYSLEELEYLLPALDQDNESEIIRREQAERRTTSSGHSNWNTGNSNWDRYVNAAISRIVADVESAEKGTRGNTLLKGAISLYSLRLSPWLPEDLRDRIDPQAILLPAAGLNGYLTDTSEAHARRTISNGLKYAQPRPQPAQRKREVSAQRNVPTGVYEPYTLAGTSSTSEPVDPPVGDLDEDERAEIANLFPLPLDGQGHSIRPDMIELAMLRRDNPRRGATHLVISKGWKNPSNAVYHRRVLYRLMRTAFRAHQATGGSIYQLRLTVGTDSEDDLELCTAEKREWDRLRKQLQREDDAKWRWFSSVTPEGAFRVIFASAPLFDGQAPLEDPEATLLETMHEVRSLGEPYKKRPAHGGPNDEWQPNHVETGDWVTVGHRLAAAVLEHNQDPYDEAAAVANNVRTWLASDAEVDGRTPEVIVRTRHWEATGDQPQKILFNLFEEVGFEVFEGAWGRTFEEQAEAVGGDRWGPARD